MIDVRFLGLAALVVSLLYYVGISSTPLRSLKNLPQEVVELDLERLRNDLAAHDRDMTLPPGGIGVLERLRSDEAWMIWELRRRRAGADRWAPGFALAGLILLGLSFAPLGRRVGSKNATKKTFDGELVSEAIPREEYVEDGDLERRVQEAFASREEALDWLRGDPLLTCDYCGAKLRSSIEGDRQEIQLVTFYRKVPEGAKDLRIHLGSFWFAKAASELKCPSCERMVRR